MNCSDLELDEHKTEDVLVVSGLKGLNRDFTVLTSSKFRNGPSLDYVNIGNERIPLSDKATSLGVVLDKHMSFDYHIKHLCKSLVCQLRNLFKIRKCHSK